MGLVGFKNDPTFYENLNLLAFVFIALGLMLLFVFCGNLIRRNMTNKYLKKKLKEAILATKINFINGVHSVIETSSIPL